MRSSSSVLVRIRSLSWLLVAAFSIHALSAEGQWKTVFYKRTFSGPFDVKSKEGTGTTVRMPVTIPFKADKIRVWVRSDFDVPIELSRIALVRAAGTDGSVEGDPVPLLFGELPGTSLAKREDSQRKAEATAALAPGLWYLETHYVSEKCSYSYDVDGGFTAPGDSQADPAVRFRGVGVFVGNAYRVEVFTEDPASVIVCYGDSITQGAGSTRMSGNNYPHALGRLLNRPVVNLGINSDLLSQAGNAHDLISRMKGATDLIFLMGINDIAWGGQIKSVADYSARVKPIFAAVKKSGVSIMIGTIPPAGGLEIFDRNPAKETLRLEINAWIRNQKNSDGVIDFDEALRDPAKPGRLREDYHSGDWIHPSDLGYQKMAAVAAEALKGGER